MFPEIAEQDIIMDFLIVFQYPQQRFPFHILIRFDTEIIKNSGGNINRLAKLFPPFPRMPNLRHPKEKWRMYDFLKARHIIFPKIAVLPQHIAMIRIYNQHRVLPHIVFIHEIQYFSKIIIHHG